MVENLCVLLHCMMIVKVGVVKMQGLLGLLLAGMFGRISSGLISWKQEMISWLVLYPE